MPGSESPGYPRTQALPTSDWEEVTPRQPHFPHCTAAASHTVQANLGDTSCVYLLFPRKSLAVSVTCDGSHEFGLALNLTPCYQRTLPPRVFGLPLQSTSFLPGDRIPSFPGNPCLPSSKELRVRPHTPPDLDLFSDNRPWAETIQRHSRYIQNNRHPMISRDSL